MTRRTIHEGRFLRFIEEDTWEFVQRRNCTGIVVIVSVTRKREAVLIEQFRRPVGKKVIEWPAGLVNDRKHAAEESFECAAKRELEEETGFRAGKIKRLMTGPVNCALTSDFVTFYLAQNLKKVSDGGGDETEDITVRLVPLSKIESWLKRQEKRGFLIDPKVYTGLYFLKNKPQIPKHKQK